jgi:hypothetical protein
VVCSFWSMPFELESMTYTFAYHQDPGHGWIEVPNTLLKQLGIASAISPWSYTRGPLAYLEEDQDAAILLRAIHGRGEAVALNELHSNSNSFVRGLNQYPSSPRWRENAQRFMATAPASIA